MSYSLHAYGGMIDDPVRAEVYARAMRQVIRPGDLVLDLGAGTGIFSLYACQLGARHVYACEPNPAIQVARELARANGLADRISCHEISSERLTLPEPVDVIVADLRGALPLHGRHLPVIADARRRHLKPGGVLLPQRDRLFVALADAPEEHRRALAPWGKNDFGFDLSAWSALLANSWNRAPAKRGQLLSPPVLWGELDYRTVESPNLRGSVRCLADREGTGHGFYLWFDATIAEGVDFSGGPDAPEKMVYGSGFFPWPRPLELAAGDEVEIVIDASLVGDDYTWSWSTRVHGGAIGDVRFSQSTFLGAPLSPDALRRRAANHVPALNEEGRLELRVLEEMARKVPLGQIAERLLVDFPGRFRSEADCLGFVGRTSSKYGE